VFDQSRKSKALTAVFLVQSLCVSGCAYVGAIPAPYGSKVSGIRVYDPKPILIVNGASVTIGIVPNYSRGYALQLGAFLAKNHAKITIDKGLVTAIDAEMDSTEFISFLKELLKKVPDAKALSGKSESTTEGGIENRFQVFDFVFDNDGNLVSLRPLVAQSDLLTVKTSEVRPPVPSAVAVIKQQPTVDEVTSPTF
jgi:hypothetical protein